MEENLRLSLIHEMKIYISKEKLQFRTGSHHYSIYFNQFGFHYNCIDGYVQIVRMTIEMMSCENVLTKNMICAGYNKVRHCLGLAELVSCTLLLSSLLLLSFSLPTKCEFCIYNAHILLLMTSYLLTAISLKHHFRSSYIGFMESTITEGINI